MDLIPLLQKAITKKKNWSSVTYFHLSHHLEHFQTCSTVCWRIMWLVLPTEFHFSAVVYQKRMLSVILLNDRELTVFSSGSWSLSLFRHPFIFLSPRLPIFRALSPGLDTLSLRSPSPPPSPRPPPPHPPPPLCLGPVWVINYSWACSEGPGLLIPAHRGLALIRPVVQLNWKPSYTSYRHTPTHTSTAHTRRCTNMHFQACHPL